MASTSPNLTEENIRQLTLARMNFRTIGRASRTAKFDGWIMIFLGVLTICFGYTDVYSDSVGAVVAAVGFVEIFGASRIKALDPRAAKLLAINQIVLGVLVIFYCFIQIHAIHNGSINKEVAQVAPEMQGSVDLSTVNSLMQMMYEAIAGVAVFYMGGFAIYYHSRIKHIEEYRTQTPAWILDLQKSGVRV